MRWPFRRESPPSIAAEIKRMDEAEEAKLHTLMEELLKEPEKQEFEGTLEDAIKAGAMAGPEPTPEQELYRKQLLERLKKALADPSLLTELERNVLTKLFLERKTYEETRNELNLKGRVQVEVNKRLALRKLRDSAYFEDLTFELKQS